MQASSTTSSTINCLCIAYPPRKMLCHVSYGIKIEFSQHGLALKGPLGWEERNRKTERPQSKLAIKYRKMYQVYQHINSQRYENCYSSGKMKILIESGIVHLRPFGYGNLRWRSCLVDWVGVWEIWWQGEHRRNINLFLLTYVPREAQEHGMAF